VTRSNGRRCADRAPAAGSSATTIAIRVLALVAVIAGCGEGHAAAMDSARADSVARARQDSVNRAQPGYIVDSILPIEEQLRRFRAGIAETPSHFDGGISSADQLVRSLIRSLEAADTASLVRLTISRAEFAYLVYPESPFAAPPYRQAPDLVWMRHAATSGTGLKRLLNRLSGAPLGFRSWQCAGQPLVEGRNRIWRDCTVQFGMPGDAPQSKELFAGIIERQGRFKVLSYANGF
jgi:hypothetical protein